MAPSFMGRSLHGRRLFGASIRDRLPTVARTPELATGGGPGGGGGGIPANAIYDRSSSAIQDRSGSYIEAR